jgi:hypothetical protein
MAIIYLDLSGKTRKAKVQNWSNDLWKGNWGRYGWWCQFNLEPYFLTTKITDEEVYAGDGFNWSWHIKWT